MPGSCQYPQPRSKPTEEPTGNLDEKSANEVFELILRLNKYYGNSLIMATHNLELSKKTDQVYELRDGILKTI